MSRATAKRTRFSAWAQRPLAAILSLLLGCEATLARDGATPSQAELRATLLGNDWTVVQIGADPVADGTRPTLRFGEDGQVSGDGSCNRYAGGYVLDREAIRVGPIATTRRACPPPAMAQEVRFLEALLESRRVSVDGTGQLVLEGGAGRTIVARR